MRTDDNDFRMLFEEGGQRPADPEQLSVRQLVFLTAVIIAGAVASVICAPAGCNGKISPLVKVSR